MLHTIWSFIVAHWWQILSIWVLGSLCVAWWMHYTDYEHTRTGDDAIIVEVGFLFAWPVFAPIYITCRLIRAIILGIGRLISGISNMLDEIMWIATRELVDENENGKLYRGWHARYCSKRYSNTRVYAVLHVKDSTGKYKIPVESKHDTVNAALAWTYHQDHYDAVRA